MTYLVQYTNVLPSTLEIASTCLKFPKGSATGTMQDLSQQNAGGYSEIVKAQMYDSGTKSWVSVASKALMGKFTEDDQVVCSQCFCCVIELRIFAETVSRNYCELDTLPSSTAAYRRDYPRRWWSSVHHHSLHGKRTCVRSCTTGISYYGP